MRKSLMGKGSGFGKVILFNEHFVVYGIPAIASAINLTTDAIVKPCEGEDIKINDLRKGTAGYSKSKLEHQKDAIKRILKSMGVEPAKNNFEITLSGNLPTFSGIGASAANCVAIARALSDELNLGLSDVRINEIAYEGEKAYAGTPSGIDNTAATYGGLIWFQKRKTNVIERLKLRMPVEIVMGNTGIVADTKAVVASVKERYEKKPELYEKIFKDAEELVYKARRAVESYDLETLGKYMNENHELLQAIEVSCKELDFLVNLAREHGALGAKLTGGGRGGCMVALTPGEKLQENVASAMEKEGYAVLRTTIG